MREDMKDVKKTLKSKEAVRPTKGLKGGQEGGLSPNDLSPDNLDDLTPPPRPGRLRAYARFLGLSFLTNLKAAAEYRGNFLLQVFGMVLNNVAFLFFWNVFLEKTGNLGGYGMNEVLFLWGLGAASFGLGHVFFGNVRSIGQIIIKGELDVYLLQPKDVLLNVASSRTSLAAWGDVLFGVGVFVYLCWGDPLRFTLFLLLCVSGSLIYMSLFTIMETLTFFMGNSTGLARTFLELMLTATLYPETIFDPGIRWIFYSLIPTAFIVFIPLRIFQLLDWSLLPVVLGAAVLYALLAWAFFRWGLKKYESGNLVGTRV